MLKEQKAAKEVRKAIKTLDRFLSVMKDLSGKEEYDNIAAQINETVADINRQIAARVTRLKNTKRKKKVRFRNSLSFFEI